MSSTLTVILLLLSHGVVAWTCYRRGRAQGFWEGINSKIQQLQALPEDDE